MTENRFHIASSAGLAIMLLAAALPGSAAAGPFSGPETVAIPGGDNATFVQLKQISGFTGHLAFGYSDGGYVPSGNSFNKLISLRMSVDCPANYRVHEAGIRVRGGDVYNYDVELVSPGDLPYNQNSWQQDLQEQPWDFDKVVAAGIDALQDNGNNGPVYVSLDEVLDSRTEFYGSCAPSQPSSGLPFIYYDSSENNGHLRPMTRVRYELKLSAMAGQHQTQTLAKSPRRSPLPEHLRQNKHTAAPALVIMVKPQNKAPDGCPYDCPPPASRLKLRR